MKRIFVHVGLAAAALAAMLALAAAPASAGTVFCDAEVTSCSQEDIKPVGTQLVTGSIYYPEGGIVIGPAGGTPRFSCTDDLMTVKSTIRNGNPMTGQLSSAIDPNCKETFLKSEGCSSVTMNSPPTTVAATSGGNGTFTIGSTGQPLTISLTCKFVDTGNETCTYAATGAVTMTLSGANATISNAPLVKSAGASVQCGFQSSQFTLTVKNVRDGAAPFIAQAKETVLCGVPGEPCGNGSILPSGTQFLAGSLNLGDHMTVSGSSKLIDCTNFGLGFATTSASGQPLAATGSYGSVNSGSCAGYSWGQRSCTGASINTPDATIQAIGSESATVEVGTAAQPLMLSFDCPNTYGLTPPVCKYEATGPVTMEVNGALGTVTVKQEPLKKVEGHFFMCGGSSAVLDIQGAYNTEALGISWI